MNNQIQICQTVDGEVQLEVSLQEETVWLSQAQMSDLFGRDQSVLSRHIRNVFKEGELADESNMQKIHIANSDKPESRWLFEYSRIRNFRKTVVDENRTTQNFFS